MKRAWRTIIRKDFSIKEIAISAGYRNALIFSEFRRFPGCSPSSFRTRKDRYSLQQKLELPHDIPEEQENYLL